MNFQSLIFTLLFLFLLQIHINSYNFEPLCSACHEIVGLISKNTPQRSFIQIGNFIGTKYCQYKHLQVKSVCKGAVTQMSEIIVNSLWRHYTDPHLVCSQIKFCKKQYKIRNITDQINQILSKNPHKQWQNPTNRKILKVMHISDLHPDLYYAVGANKKCSQPVCCRANVTSEKRLTFIQMLNKYESGQILKNQNNQDYGDNSAGYWGSLAKCDLPFQTFDLFLKQLSKLKLDLIIWTGDNTPHDIWQQTQSYNLNYTIALTQRLKRYTNATIIPAMGNHQSAPVNVYDYQGTRQQVLIGGLANAWRQWLDEKAYNMLRTKGYYSIELPQLNNVKIISMNTQASNDQNWFLLRDPTDPGQMLKWIQQQLEQSQKINQFVYIIGHIPPKSSLNDWSMRFNALVQRYSYIIRGQFYGHSHADHIGFFPSFQNKSKITSFYLLAPSITTYSDKNPNYRVMTIDYDTLQVLDYDQYMLDLRIYQTEQQKAKFDLFYSFKKVYNISDMTISGGITELYKKMEQNPQTRKLYTYLMSGGLEQGQTGKNVFCDTLTSPQLVTQCNGGVFKKDAFQKAAGPWKTLTHKQ